MKQAQDLQIEIKTALAKEYPAEEANALSNLILEHFGIQKTDFIFRKEVDIDEKAVFSIVNKILNKEPLQYILGHGHFYGREFLVNPDVLIPRQETEELVYLALNNLRNMSEKCQVLDIGTGSGCIPITLSLENPTHDYTGLDFSAPALETAKKNSKQFNAAVKWVQADILKDEFIPVKPLDMIISNPPYVTELEKKFMHGNVLDHEPHTALFVSNDTPLIFYDKIADFGIKNLKDGGLLLFEINEKFGHEMYQLLEQKGYQEISVLDDLNGKKRMSIARKQKPLT